MNSCSSVSEDPLLVVHIFSCKTVFNGRREESAMKEAMLNDGLERSQTDKAYGVIENKQTSPDFLDELYLQRPVNSLSRCRTTWQVKSRGGDKFKSVFLVTYRAIISCANN